MKKMKVSKREIARFCFANKAEVRAFLASNPL